MALFLCDNFLITSLKISSLPNCVYTIGFVFIMQIIDLRVIVEVMRFLCYLSLILLGFCGLQAYF